MNYMKIAVLGMLILFMAGCMRVTQESAEAKAIQFVKERVKFYARDNSSTVDIPTYSFSKVNSYQKDNSWFVIIQISRIENTSKRTDVVVEINIKSGEVVTFNNNPVNNQ
jgi:hypothetical protein